MRVFLAVLVLIFSFQSWTKADDIRDFEIEGISVGDSLLSHFTKKQVLNIINSYDDKGYSFKTRDFYSITIRDNKFKKYDSIQISLKDKDPNYIVNNPVDTHIITSTLMSDC